MIPVKLELQNFLAYRSPEPLDLTGLHLACLAGPNGAGKSSLLDAITWALWGKARAQRDDELIHSGELEMSVRLEFSLEGNLYRVMRYRSRQGRGASDLLLEILDGKDWRSISEGTIRATQDKISRLLRLDYATFINSAFLMQGRADEFTTKTPGERKSILAEILGLDAWVEYEERAKRRLRLIDDQCNQLDARVEAIDAELACEKDYQRDLIQAQQELDSLNQHVHEADIRYRELEAARLHRDAHQQAYSDGQTRLQEVDLQLSRLQGERQQLLDRLAAYQSALARADEIEMGYASLMEARRIDRSLSDQLFEQHGLSRRRSELQQVLAAERARLEAELRALRQRSEELERIIHEVDSSEVLREAEQQIAELERREEERERLQVRQNELREERADLEGHNRSLRSEMDRLKGQLAQIEGATEPVCPLCGQHLGADHRADLIRRLSEEGQQRGALFRANRDRVRAINAEERELVKAIQAADQELRRLPPLREYVTRQTERITRVAEALSQLELAQEQTAALEAQLAAGEYAIEARAALRELDAQLAGLGYDEQAHQQARAVIAENEVFEALRADLERARESIPELEATLDGLDQQARSWESQRAKEMARLDELAAEIEALDQQLAEMGHWERLLADLRDQEMQARERVGAAKQRLNALEQQRARRESLLRDRDQLVAERVVYEELRLAFGKDGIPAMIIEAAIPEIEQEANEVLARMTDGRMHIRFDTQREKITGGVKETLDIKIADELGTRDYFTFSGGEAFRVNFAIRLALSRLLARRAGAQLRTLIIDEGFGTQDAQGRERLVQAINAIQDEFDLILVITHIDELKDAFPARIEISKTPYGSQIEVV